MLGVGWTEMLVIGVVALIVIGPKELPAVMRKIGQFAGTVRRMGQDFQRELNKTTGLNEITNLRNSVTQPLKATADAIRKEFNATDASGKVTPSGALKPADPKAESVVDEIRAKAGMEPVAKPAPMPLTANPVMRPKPAEPAKAGAASKTDAAPVKAKRALKVKLPTDTPVVSADLPAPAAKATKAAAKPKAATADAPAATPAASKAAARKAPTKAKPAEIDAKPASAARTKAVAKPKAAAKAPPAESTEPAPKPARKRAPAAGKA